ncbi:MAG: anti-sigma factor [Actinomycetota bacterium]
MNKQEKDKMLELLSDKAVFGLSEAEFAELRELEKNFPEFRDESLELSAAAIGMMNLDTSEPMPAHLQTKIAADAEQFFAARNELASHAEPQAEKEEFQKTFAFEPKSSIWQWLGWAIAGLACIALAINIWITRPNQTQIADVKPTPTITPKPELTLTEQREQLLASAKDAVQTTWGDFDPKKPKNVQGDVVWSNSAQKGFVRFRNLPVNDKNKETYQLWIFDDNQKQPIDGGIFDANENGEIIIPLDAKLKVQKPKMFAVTAEKPGGVVVSPLEKVMAVAKVSV